jgi:hypothetical protein
MLLHDRCSATLGKTVDVRLQASTYGGMLVRRKAQGARLGFSGDAVKVDLLDCTTIVAEEGRFTEMCNV